VREELWVGPDRLQSGHITCYLNRTYHVLPTPVIFAVDIVVFEEYFECQFGERKSGVASSFTSEGLLLADFPRK
jgi:hypothetical protein